MKTERAIIRMLEGKAKVPQQIGSFQYPSKKQWVKSLIKDFKNSILVRTLLVKRLILLMQ